MATPVARSSLLQANLFETIISGLVILVAVAFAIFMNTETGTGHLGSYPLTIRMRDAAGLSVGTDVQIGGVKIGSVSALDIDPRTYTAVVTIRIRDDLSLPEDSRAAVASTLMNDTYLAITPGHARRVLAPGGEFPLSVPTRPGRDRLS